MQFNSEANSLDIVSDIKYWCGIDASDSTSYTTAQMARNSNFALDRIHALILRSDGAWKHDDTNNTSTEILDVATNIASGTRKYAISLSWLKIARVRIKDANGEWITLKQGDRRTWSQAQLDGDSGTPTEYILLGNWLYLDRNPNYTQSGGLEVQYQRGPSYFAASDTTKTPGFATHFHRLVSLHAALDYCEVNDLDSRAAKIRNKIGSPPTEATAGYGLELELVEHYATRNIDDKPSLQAIHDDYGQMALGEHSSGSNRPNGFAL